MLDSNRVREYVKSFNFTKLFIEELGWDRHANRLGVPIDGQLFNLAAIAQKKGMVAFNCDPCADGETPDHATRRKIERQVSKSVHEHLILYVDRNKTTQIWQWVKREPGKPTACREHIFHQSQDGEALVQKLQAIAFSLAEEESLTIVDVTRRARKAFDVERVTKRFYDEFRKQHAAFLKFITGIPVKEDHEWYASVMLNRLMFIYFIQRKGFLDGDHDYLRNRLNRTKQEHGKDRFYSFYRYFLLRLFHEGLGGRARNPELDKLLGRIPYLNGGLFDVHELEKPDRYGKAIQIPDEAFEAIFDYFDGCSGTSMSAHCATTQRSIPASLASSLRNTSTKSRWARTTPRRTLPTISARTPSFRFSSTPRESSAGSPLRILKAHHLGPAQERSRALHLSRPPSRHR